MKFILLPIIFFAVSCGSKPKEKKFQMAISDSICGTKFGIWSETPIELREVGTVDILMPDSSVKPLFTDSVHLTTTGTFSVFPNDKSNTHTFNIPVYLKNSYLMVISAYGNHAYMNKDSSITIEGDTMKIIKQLFIDFYNNNKKRTHD